MITLTKEELDVLTVAAAELSRAGDKILSSDIVSILNRAKDVEQQINHQEGAAKVLPPKQDYNFGCNAARYPYS